MPILEGYTDEEKRRLGLLPDTIEAINAGFPPSPAPIVPEAPVAPQPAPGFDFSGAPPQQDLVVPRALPADRLELAAQGKREGIDREVSATFAGMTDREKEFNRYQKEIGRIRAEDELEESTIMSNIRNRMGDHERKLDEFRSMKVDPNRFFTDPDGSRNWTNTAIASIASAMGAFGAAMTGSPNFAQQIMQKAIDRDIQGQKDNINKKGAEIDESNNLLAQNFRLYKTEQQANLATRAQVGTLYASKLDNIAAGAKDATRLAQLGQIKAGIEEGVVKDTMQLERLTSAEERAESAERRLSRESDAQIGLIEAKKSQITDQEDGGKLKRLPASVVQGIAGLKNANLMLDNLGKDWTDKANNWWSGMSQYFVATDATSYNDRRKPTAQVIGQILEGGKLTDSDFARYMNMLPTAGDGEDRKNNKIKALKELLRIKREGEGRSLTAAGYETRGIGAPAPGSLESLGAVPNR